MKAGIKTSEFWLGLLTIILTYLNSALGWHIPVEVVVSVIGMVTAYIAGRTWLKSTH